jgi:hypothetical protein
MPCSTLVKSFFLCCLGFFSLSLAGQKLPESYSGLASYIDQHTLTDSLLNAIDAHWSRMNPEHVDSLRSTVFPRLVEKSGKLNASKRCLTYEIISIAAYQLLGDISLTEKYGTLELELREEMGNTDSLAISLSRFMFMQVSDKTRESALSTALRLRGLLSKMEDPHVKSFAYRQLCIFYQYINDYERGMEMCREAERYMVQEKKNNFLNAVYETLALFYEKDDVQEAIALRRKAIAASLAQGDSFNLRTTYRNMARDFSGLEQVDSAQKYFELTFDLYARFPYVYGWFADQISYGHFLLNQKRVEEAQQVADTLSSVYEKMDQQEEHAMQLAGLMEYLAVVKEDVPAYLHWSGERNKLMTEYYSAEKAKSLEKLSVEYETEKKEAENAILKQENRASRMQLILVLFVLGVLILIVILVLQRRAHEKKISAQKQELLSLNLEKSRLEQRQLKRRNHDLLEDIQKYVKQVVEQQSVNGELLDLIDELRKAELSPVAHKKTTQMKVRLNDQITREAFREILDRMEEVYPAFYAYLKAQVGADKESELLVTTMYFLGYDTKNIATVLNRTEKAVRSIRYRVRKKLNLTDNDDFLEFLKSEQERLSEVEMD